MKEGERHSSPERQSFFSGDEQVIETILTSTHPELLLSVEAQGFQNAIFETAVWNSARNYQEAIRGYSAASGFANPLFRSQPDFTGDITELHVEHVLSLRHEELQGRIGPGEYRGRLVWSDPNNTLTGGEVPDATYGFFDINDAPPLDYAVGFMNKRTKKMEELEHEYREASKVDNPADYGREESMRRYYQFRNRFHQEIMVDGLYMPPGFLTDSYIVSWVPNELALFIEEAIWRNMSDNIGWLSGELTVRNGKIVKHEAVPELEYRYKDTEINGKKYTFAVEQIFPETGFWAEAKKSQDRLLGA